MTNIDIIYEYIDLILRKSARDEAKLIISLINEKEELNILIELLRKDQAYHFVNALQRMKALLVHENKLEYKEDDSFRDKSWVKIIERIKHEEEWPEIEELFKNKNN